MARKTLSLALAVVMVLSLLSISAFATGEAATFTVTSSAASVVTDDIITITVTAQSAATYYAGPLSVPVTYDPSAFQYVANSATVNNIFGAGVTDSAVNVDATNGKVTVAVSPLTNGSPVAPNLTTALTIFTFQLKALNGSGAYTIGIANDQKTSTNPTGKFYCGNFSTSDPKTADLTPIGQTLTRVDTSVSFGPAGVCALILTATGESYGTIIRDDLCTTNYDGCVFGIDTLNGEDILDYVTTEVGSVEVEPNINGEYTTGATILLKDASDTLVATYVFIYFGDVNGDGMVDITDASAVEEHDGWITVLDDDSAEFYSADVNYDGMVDITDAAAIEEHDGWIALLDDQNVIADGFNMAW